MKNSVRLPPVFCLSAAAVKNPRKKKTMGRKNELL